LFNEIDESHLVTGECINGIYIEYIGDERGGRFLAMFSADDLDSYSFNNIPKSVTTKKDGRLSK
jgi:hypothetical protein